MTQPILSPELPTGVAPARARITANWLRDETEAVNDLLAQATLPPVEREKVIDLAADLVTRVRARAKDQSAVESFMRQYDLSSEEGVLLMCVAATRNFSRSADHRNVTQPAFSRRIRALEAWTGAELVDRSTYPLTLTVAGKLFNDAASEALKLLNDARNQLRSEHTAHNMLRVTAGHSLANRLWRISPRRRTCWWPAPRARANPSR